MDTQSQSDKEIKVEFCLGYSEVFKDFCGCPKIYLFCDKIL